MARVAVVAPETSWRRVLTELADAGAVEPDLPDRAGPAAGEPDLDRVTGASVARNGVRALRRVGAGERGGRVWRPGWPRSGAR